MPQTKKQTKKLKTVKKHTVFVKILALVPLSLFILYSCDYLPKKVDEEVIATAYGEKFYRADLENIVPPNVSQEDSINIVRRYVDNWVRQQVVVEFARKNLSEEQMDFEKKIREYKNSLIIFAFENHFIGENLDTTVKHDQISEYYESHKQYFKLKENIAKVTYAKVPLNAPDQHIPRELCRSHDPEELEKLENYCIQHAATYFIDTDTWLVFDEVLREVPVRTSSQQTFLRNNRYVEISDQYYRYFLYIHDLKLQGNESPLSFAIDNIRNIILNKRKQELIKNLRNELYREAIKSGNFEIFI